MSLMHSAKINGQATELVLGVKMRSPDAYFEATVEIKRTGRSSETMKTGAYTDKG